MGFVRYCDSCCKITICNYSITNIKYKAPEVFEILAPKILNFSRIIVKSNFFIQNLKCMMYHQSSRLTYQRSF